MPHPAFVEQCQARFLIGVIRLFSFFFFQEQSSPVADGLA